MRNQPPTDRAPRGEHAEHGAEDGNVRRSRREKAECRPPRLSPPFCERHRHQLPRAESLWTGARDGSSAFLRRARSAYVEAERQSTTPRSAIHDAWMAIEPKSATTALTAVSSAMPMTCQNNRPNAGAGDPKKRSRITRSSAWSSQRRAQQPPRLRETDPRADRRWQQSTSDSRSATRRCRQDLEGTRGAPSARSHRTRSATAHVSNGLGVVADFATSCPVMLGDLERRLERSAVPVRRRLRQAPEARRLGMRPPSSAQSRD